MSDENGEFEEGLEEEIPLTAEELFEQHKAEIDAAFEEKGFFRRFGDMLKGLSKPHASAEYKLARTELQRLAAPILAIVLPVVGVIVLIVVTAVTGKQATTYQADIAQAQQDDAPLEDTPDPPEEEIDMTQDVDVNVDVSTDVPTPEMNTPAPPTPDPGGEPDKVAAAPSPVTMSAVSGTVKMRGLGDGASGFGTLIGGKGKAQNIEGCLIGIIIDFKKTASGEKRAEFSVGARGGGGGYWNDAKSLVDGNFSPKALSKFFVPPKRVALTHLFIKAQSAGNGPKAFGVADVMKPSGFVVYYSGKIRATESARYRFVGYFDDMLLARIDRRTVFEDCYGHKKKGTKYPVTGWTASSEENGKWPSFQGMASPLTVGDWFDVIKGKEYFIEIMCGERPGGEIGGVLFIQKEGEKYEVDKKTGRPILPVFASRPLSYKEKETIRAYSYRVSVDSPRFNSRGGEKSRKQMSKGDVSVQVDI